MILQCNYEEVTALRAGAHVVIGGEGEAGGPVAAPPAERASVEALLPRLAGDVSVHTLEDQRTVAFAVRVIVECLREEMEVRVVEGHAAAETAVAAYFDFAHALSVLARVREMGEEMEAMIEVVTGEAVTPETARGFVFPD